MKFCPGTTVQVPFPLSNNVALPLTSERENITAPGPSTSATPASNSADVMVKGVSSLPFGKVTGEAEGASLTASSSRLDVEDAKKAPSVTV